MCLRCVRRKRSAFSSAAGVLLGAVLIASTSGAQNPVASKVVGSGRAAENRRATTTFGEAEAVARDTENRAQSRDVLDSAVSNVAQRYNLILGIGPRKGLEAAPTARQWLDSLKKIPTLKSLVDEAIALEREQLGSASINGGASICEAALGRALARVLKAESNGHNNPERWYLGGQVGVPLFGGDGLGTVMRASARASYFIPISPFRRWQLPVVSNLGELTAGAADSDKEKAKKLISSSDGAYVSLEPTWDPVYRSSLGDFRVQPFLAIGGQVNHLKSKSDSTATVSLGQGRFGAGANLEIGRRTSGQPVLFVTSRAVAAVYDASAYEKAFGERRRSRMILESYALLPVGGSTALLIESSVGRASAPFFRIGLWAQALAQRNTDAALDTPTPKAAK